MEIKNTSMVQASFHEKCISVMELKKLLAMLEDADLLYPNSAGNLGVGRDEFQIGYIDIGSEKLNLINAPEKNATDQLREARHNALRVRYFKEIHVSADFLLRLEACEDFEDIVGNKVINETYPNDLFGFPYVVHREKTDTEFWFVDEYGQKIVSH